MGSLTMVFIEPSETFSVRSVHNTKQECVSVASSPATNECVYTHLWVYVHFFVHTPTNECMYKEVYIHPQMSVYTCLLYTSDAADE